MTNFPNGVASYGLPVLGNEWGGIPGKGNVYFLDPVNGSDGNSGNSVSQAFKTLTKAYAALTADQNDTIIYLGAASAGITLTAALVWAKNCTHLVGVASPTFMNIRSRISFGANFSPGITVSASGCSFRNLYFPYGRGNAANLIAMSVTGSRNYFENCHWLPGNATEMAQAGFKLLDLNGAQECTFAHCTIGGTTIERTAANNLVYISNSAGRLLFEGCTFLSEITGTTTPLVISVANAVNALQEFAIFRRCSFLTYSVNQAAKLANAIVGGPATGGVIMLDQCGFVGFTKVATTNASRVWIIGAEGNTAATQGLAVNPA